MITETTVYYASAVYQTCHQVLGYIISSYQDNSVGRTYDLVSKEEWSPAFKATWVFKVTRLLSRFQTQLSLTRSDFQSSPRPCQATDTDPRIDFNV